MRQLGAVVMVMTALAVVHGQPATGIESLLRDRLAASPADIARFMSGSAAAWTVPGSTGTEIAASGAVRVKGDLRRLVAWLRDIEAFMRASGSVDVGAIGHPATAADFSGLDLPDADLADLRACSTRTCDIRMPDSFQARFEREVTWGAISSRAQAEAVARTLAAEYMKAYQSGGDAALAAFHDPATPDRQAGEVVDLVRRAAQLWGLQAPVAHYLETFPKEAPPQTESRFYWSQANLGRKPVLTLHHVVLQQLPGGAVLIADKQVHASREIDAGLLMAYAVPNADFTSFDLVASIRARSELVRGLTGRVLHGVIDHEMRVGLGDFLEWIRASLAL